MWVLYTLAGYLHDNPAQILRSQPANYSFMATHHLPGVICIVLIDQSRTQGGYIFYFILSHIGQISEATIHL